MTESAQWSRFSENHVLRCLKYAACGHVVQVPSFLDCSRWICGAGLFLQILQHVVKLVMWCRSLPSKTEAGGSGSFLHRPLLTCHKIAQMPDTDSGWDFLK